MSPVVSCSVSVSADFETVTPAAVGITGVSNTSDEYAPALAPVRVALTRTVYSVPLLRLGIVWLVVEPEPMTARRPLLL